MCMYKDVYACIYAYMPIFVPIRVFNEFYYHTKKLLACVSLTIM